jgi:hypothetical protein
MAAVARSVDIIDASSASDSTGRFGAGQIAN